MTEEKIDFQKYIRDIPDWPKKGILFRDITPLLAEPEAFSSAVEAMCRDFRDCGIEYVAAVEARGFMFAGAVAKELKAGFVPIRKKGKLPWKKESVTYELEYGVDTLEVHSDAVTKGAKILMIDDLLATGGTMAASCRLMEKIGAQIEAIVFLIELTELAGREKLKDYNIKTIITY